jgi:magnesium-transporting ATPase (P-type)
VPFNSTNKFALSVVTPPEGECPGKQYVLMKGAPEIILARCNRWLCGGVEKPLDEDFQKQFTTAYECFAMAGERVLGFARQNINFLPDDRLNKDTVPTNDFLFMGLVSLMDPPKLGVDQAVTDCRTAGIRVFMVTGDHALTAEAIAKKVNILTLPTRNDIAAERGVPVAEVDMWDPEVQAIVITGSQLKDLTEDQWQKLLDHKEIAFARTTPQQKLGACVAVNSVGHEPSMPTALCATSLQCHEL